MSATIKCPACDGSGIAGGSLNADYDCVGDPPEFVPTHKSCEYCEGDGTVLWYAPIADAHASADWGRGVRWSCACRACLAARAERFEPQSTYAAMLPVRFAS